MSTEQASLFTNFDQSIEAQHDDLIYFQDYYNPNSKSDVTDVGRYYQAAHKVAATIKKDYSTPSTHESVRKHFETELINFAYNSITAARDLEYDKIERSNFFDEWKDTLDTILLTAKNLSSNHRKILGALIVAIKQKDIADFEAEGLRTLENVTYMLRQYRVNRNDSKKAIKDLLDLKMTIVIPLIDDESDSQLVSELDEYMKSVIKKYGQ